MRTSAFMSYSSSVSGIDRKSSFTKFRDLNFLRKVSASIRLASAYSEPEGGEPIHSSRTRFSSRRLDLFQLQPKYFASMLLPRICFACISALLFEKFENLSFGGWGCALYQVIQ